MTIDTIIQKVNSGRTLNIEEMELLMTQMMSGKLSDAQIASSLIAMKLRGETVYEVATAAKVLNANKVVFKHDKKPVVDTCGTGGDGKSTLNISTAVSIILAAMNIDVVKHGNVALSGKVGSANILDSCGVPLTLEPEQAAIYFDTNNFIFLFAQAFHPTMKHVGPIRKELKVPTLFNFLGPLLSPANPDYQMIGFSNRDRLAFYADVIAALGRQNVAVYTSDDGYDEISASAPTTLYLVRCDHTEDLNITGEENGIQTAVIDPADFFEPFEMPVVTDADDAKAKFMAGISGENPQYANLLAINTALMLTLMGKGNMKANFDSVLNTIKSGTVIKKLESLRL